MPISSCGSCGVLWRISENEGLGDRAAGYRGSADSVSVPSFPLKTEKGVGHSVSDES